MPNTEELIPSLLSTSSAAPATSQKRIAGEFTMVPIPKQINFFWTGGPLPEQYKEIIRDIAEKAKTSGYIINLWTDGDKLDTLNEFKTEPWNLPIITRDWREVIDPCLEEVTNDRAKAAKQFLAFRAAGKVDDAIPNYAAMSDIFRLLVLDIYGGLYDDTDNKIVKCTGAFGDVLVPSTTGFKIQCHSGSDQLVNNSTIACLPQSYLTQTALAYIAKIYETGITLQPDLIMFETEQALEAYKARQRSEPISYLDRFGFAEPSNPELPIEATRTTEIDMHRTDLAYWVTRPGFCSDYFKKQIRVYFTVNYTGPLLVKRIYDNIKDTAIKEASRFKGDYTAAITDTISIHDGQDASWVRHLQVTESCFTPTFYQCTTMPKIVHTVVLADFNFSDKENAMKAASSLFGEGYMLNTCEYNSATTDPEYLKVLSHFITEQKHNPFAKLACESFLAYVQLEQHGGIYLCAPYQHNTPSGSSTLKICDIVIDPTLGFKTNSDNGSAPIIACLPGNLQVRQAQVALLTLMQKQLDEPDVAHLSEHAIYQTWRSQQASVTATLTPSRVAATQFRMNGFDPEPCWWPTTLLETKRSFDSPLIAAIKYANLTQVTKLLVNIELNDLTAIECALRCQREDIFDLLLARINPALLTSALFNFAARHCSIHVVECLLTKKPDLIKAPFCDALHKAAAAGRDDVVSYLLSQGIDIDAIDEKNATPLLWAVKAKHENIAIMLINAGANINTNHAYYGSILHLAIEQELKSVICLLLQKKVDINAQNAQSVTPLMTAINQPNFALAIDLIHAGARLDLKDTFFNGPRTALDWVKRRIEQNQDNPDRQAPYKLIATVIETIVANPDIDRAKVITTCQVESTRVALLPFFSGDAAVSTSNPFSSPLLDRAPTIS